MSTTLATIGAGYFAAIIAIFVASLMSNAGAARAPDEEAPRRGFVMAALSLASVLTPFVVALYAYAVTPPDAAITRVTLVAAPFAASFLGALSGALIGLFTREARIMFRMASIVTGFGALILALGVALPHVDTAWAAAQTSKLVGAVAHMPRVVN